MKNKKNKSLAAILLVFALVFVTGGVYAAASGVLTFEGVANLNSNVTEELKLEYQYDTASPPIGTNGSTGTIEITPDGQTINVTANIKNPGDYVDFHVYVANTGTVDATLGKYTLTSPDYSASELSKIISVADESGRMGSPTLNGLTIKAGETVHTEYTVHWLNTPEAAAHAGESINFSLQIGYAPA